MKGQSTIEFLGGIVIFLIVIVASLSVLSGRVPKFTDDVAQSSQNMEMYRVTNQILTESGRHSYGPGGANWEKNSSTVSHATEFGLAADHKVLAYDKIARISTTGGDSFNYSQFRDINRLRNQYFFNLTWLPVVETSSTFTKTEPPSSNPEIVEPDTEEYDRAENRIHYGSIELFGGQYNFLVAAFDGVYNTTYISEDNNRFNESSTIHAGMGDVVDLGAREYTVEQIQNRDRRPGASIILRKPLKSFGPSPGNTEESVTKLNRYAVLEAAGTDRGIVRMEVLSW